MGLITDLLVEVGQPGSATTLSSPGKAIGASNINVGSTANWPSVGKKVYFAMRVVDPTLVSFTSTNYNPSGVKPGTYTEWMGIVGTNSITNLAIAPGSPNADQVYTAGTNTQVFIPVMAARENALVTWGSAQHNQDGTHSAITATSVTATGTVTAANFVQTGGASANGWTVGLAAPNTITYNGNRSYSMVFNGTDLTGTLSPGMRLRTTRTVAAPTQCTSLNGTTQYYSKTSPAGMTFTNNFVVSAYVKLNSYNGTSQSVVSRYNGTSGWGMYIDASGRVILYGNNAGSANFSQVLSAASVPTNKWVHIAAQLDMATFTATPTTSYVMIDGLDVSATVSRGGTNPTALVQAGNLEVGSQNGGLLPFGGKIAQAAVFNAKVTQSTMQGYYSQSLVGTETSLISAYSFNNTINDLNTTNANNLTPNGSAVATSADSPFGGQAGGTISSNLDYAEIMASSFSTNTTLTLLVPRGNTIPTSGGVSAVAYSSSAFPYGWPGGTQVLGDAILCSSFTSNATSATSILGASQMIYVPAGGREVEINFSARDVFRTGGGITDITLYTGAAYGTLTTQIAGAEPNSPSGSASPMTIAWKGMLPPGLTYINAALSSAATANSTLEATTGAPAQLNIKLLG